MSNVERTILPVVDPTIKTDPILLEDQESPEAIAQRNPAIPGEVQSNTSARAGAWVPIVAVRSILLDDSELRSVTMSLSGKIPRVSVTMRDVQRKFSVNFPLDGDVLSLYLRPPDVENQRPIRVDFDIMSVSSSPATQSYTISGIMKVPRMFGEVCRAFPKGTSHEHLQAVAEELGLGFASNETATNDAMVRICPYETYETFVQSTVKTAYRDDDSFFTWYIDPFYYLCLVNVNRQFSLDDTPEEVNLSYAAPLSGAVGQEGAPDTIKGSLVLTNMPERSGMNNYIEAYSLENNSADVWIANGYKRTAQYYDADADSPEYVKSFVDPLTTPGSEQDQILLKGRKGEDLYLDTVKYKWLGKQHAVSAGGNVHDNYLFASLLNHQNLSEIGKMTLRVNLAGMNFYVSKWARVPVLIYEPGTNPKSGAMLKKRDSELGDPGTADPEKSEPFNRAGGANADSAGDGLGEQDWTKNEFLSGYYVVSGIDYKYTPPGPVKQVLTLVRREWPIPARNKDV